MDNWCKNCEIESDDEFCPECGEYIDGERRPPEDEGPDPMSLAHAEMEWYL